MERAFLLIVAFDGTDFCGWQVQPDGRSVQRVLEGVLSRLGGSTRKATAAGRTDAGVHARAMPVSTVMPPSWTCAALLRAMNALLPLDVAVREVHRIRDDANARRDALGRRYCYHVGTDAAARSPFQARTAWPLGRLLDLDAMERAATVLPGVHDCRAFAVTGESKPHYRCRIVEAAWDSPSAGCTRFTIAADRFLHHMVRLLVGTMVDIGLGRRPEGDMARLLLLTHNADTSPPAPAAGLFFDQAWYPEDIYLGEVAAW